METRSAKRRKLRNPNYLSENNTGEDRISDLPDAVLHRILFLLSLNTIVQTSILSKRWRTIWYTFPDLDFINIAPSIKFDYFENMGNVITQILSLRDKFSDVRILRFCGMMTFSGLNALIRNAVRLRVQELDISVETNDAFNFPRSLITHDCLRVLKVTAYNGCRLPPSMIMKSGFQTLRTLSLFFVLLDNQSSLLDIFTDCSFPQLRDLSLHFGVNLKHLRVGCGLLQKLSIGHCYSLQGLEISSPRLEKLWVLSCFGEADIDNTWLQINAPRLHTFVWSNNPITSKNCIQNLVCLREATVTFGGTQQILDADKCQRMSSFLSGVSRAMSLKVESPFVEIMSKNNTLAAIFFDPFVKLESLELHTTEVSSLASVLKVCPMIHTLIIKITNPYKPERRWNGRTWESQRWESLTKDLEPLFCYLKVVKIDQQLFENDITLVELLLKHGKVLQDLIFNIRDYNLKRREKIISRIMGIPRASTDVKLAFH